MKDIYNDIKVVHLLDAQDITDHTDKATKYADLQGFESATVLVNYGTVSTVDASNNVIAKLQECDASPNLNASWVDVATSDITGAFGLIDANTKDQTTQAVGYIGSKRYIRVLLDFASAGTHPNHCNVSVDAILGYARHGLATDATVTTGTSTG